LKASARDVLNLFYDEEPNPDRWLAFDRYPRRLVHRLVRGKPNPGGQMRMFLNLCAGLDRLGVHYRVNDYRFIKSNPGELACIIGTPIVLDKIAWRNPILYGPAVSPPVDDPLLLERLPVKKVLVPGPWVEAMFKPYWGSAVQTWPVGIDVDRWQPISQEKKQFDVLLYDKILWEHDQLELSLIEPIRATLRKYGRSFTEIRYGFYREEEYWELLGRSQTMVFLCEHESQGIAYQQALSCGVPILAWDRGGPWNDPAYYPHRIIYEPVTSVPYWDERCGLRFTAITQFDAAWAEFWDAFQRACYTPRPYIMENLTLEKCAREYVKIAETIVA